MASSSSGRSRASLARYTRPPASATRRSSRSRVGPRPDADAGMSSARVHPGTGNDSIPRPGPNRFSTPRNEGHPATASSSSAARTARSLPNGTTSWYWTKPRGPYRRCHDPTASSGWKKADSGWRRPRSILGAFRNHATLKARAVAGRRSPNGTTAGTSAAGRGANRSGSCRARGGSSSSVAWSPRVRTPRPRCRPRARQSIQATEYRYRWSPSSMHAISSSRSAARSVSTRTREVCTARSSMVARTITPVSPMPPAVARKASPSPAGVTARRPRAGVRRSMATTWSANPPSTWWFLPCTSLAMAPPTVTWRVPGVTSTNHPRGTTARRRASRLVPAPTVTRPAPGSTWATASSPCRPDSSTTRPPAFWAASP